MLRLLLLIISCLAVTEIGGANIGNIGGFGTSNGGFETLFEVPELNMIPEFGHKVGLNIDGIDYNEDPEIDTQSAPKSNQITAYVAGYKLENGIGGGCCASATGRGIKINVTCEAEMEGIGYLKFSKIVQNVTENLKEEYQSNYTHETTQSWAGGSNFFWLPWFGISDSGEISNNEAEYRYKNGSKGLNLSREQVVSNLALEASVRSRLIARVEIVTETDFPVHVCLGVRMAQITIETKNSRTKQTRVIYPDNPVMIDDDGKEGDVEIKNSDLKIIQ